MKIYVIVAVITCCVHSLPSHSAPRESVAHMELPVHKTIRSSDSCDINSDNDRFDCHPDPMATKQSCMDRGCCWKPMVTNGNINVPYCYFPSNYPSYIVDTYNATDPMITLMLSRTEKTHWPKDIMKLRVDIIFETNTRLHFKIYDPTTMRYEVPLPKPPLGGTPMDPQYSVKITYKPFGIRITRMATSAVVFDTTSLNAPLIFADQFLQLSTHLGTGLLYGLGEHQTPFLINNTWTQLNFWARDQSPQNGINLYGTHPFYTALESDGKAHGVFLLNSNAMDVDIQPTPALTYRSIGGILDFYVFLGPSHDDVIMQYTDLIGKPFFPPYWSLGFHLCRYGYGSGDNLKNVIKRNRDLKIPYEVQWTDIDYMDQFKDWTYDHKAYKDLPNIVADLHHHGQKYIIIVDPGISNTQKPGSYPPYDEGLKAGVFVKDTEGKNPIVGKVWPGSTVFPDFASPSAHDWWYNQSSRFHSTLPFDGLWTDMNEPSNFVFGSMSGCPKNDLNNPPYRPGIAGDLPQNTLCPSAKHNISTHYNLHSMFGHFEVNATMKALHRILKKRSIVISRSTFPSTGVYGGHWTGDIRATYTDMYYTIPQILNFQMFGISLVGADICGFGGNTTEELCTRWMQLGAFYPFMRNHNDLHSMDQDPGVFSRTAQETMKFYLMVRYTLLPYLYTLFFHNHRTGIPVARSLMAQYPTDSIARAVDRQFLWGNGLLISPVLEQGATSVNAYFPHDKWYDGLTFDSINSTGSTVTLYAPLDRIPFHYRGGTIIPMQPAFGTTTQQTRMGPFVLLVALNSSGAAEGDLYWDDGDSLDSIDSGKYDWILFSAHMSSLTSTVKMSGYKPAGGLSLNLMSILGVAVKPSQVIVNGQKLPMFNYDQKLQVLEFTMKADLLQPLNVMWH